MTSKQLEKTADLVTNVLKIEKRIKRYQDAKLKAENERKALEARRMSRVPSAANLRAAAIDAERRARAEAIMRLLVDRDRELVEAATA